MERIPVIDVGALKSSSISEIESLAKTFERVARSVGFMYIVNHGIPDESVAEVFEASRWFHSQATEAKLKLTRNKWFRGYEPPFSVTLKKSAKFAAAKKPSERSTFLIRQETNEDDSVFPMNGPNQWPDNEEFKATVSSYNRALTRLGVSMLPAFSIAMGQPSDYLSARFNPPSTTLSLLRYAPTPAIREEDEFGSAPHTDYGFLTFLTQDSVGGLEVQGVDGSWITAPPIPGAYVVNIGDALARWTNDIFRSTPHRVINKSSERERLSIAFFFDPHHSARIDVLPKFVGSGVCPRFEPVTFGDYFVGRLSSNVTTPKEDVLV